MVKPGLVTSIAGPLVVMLLCAGRIGAQTSTANVTLAINTTQAAASPIPSDFSGLSFEMGSVIYDSGNKGWYLSGTNANMVALLKTLGVKSIRVGGNSAETGNIATNADEDAVLDFCHAIGGNLIWDLEIDGTLYDPPGKAAIAQSMQNYVTAKGYGTNILVFQVGNEPDLTPDPNNPGHNMGVTTYDSEFSNYVVAANQLYSGSRWAGPDCAGGGTWFSGTFCPTEAAAWPGQVAFVCQHDYPFGSSLDTNTAAVHISWMLAAGNEAGYQSFNNQWVPPAFAAGLAPRYEECNSFFHNGSFGASDAYASALWGLSWMYFQANAGLAGINFHTGLNANNPAYSAITPANVTTNYTVHPLAYAIAAFNLGGHGKIVPVTIGNPSSANVVAYSVLQNDGSLILTVINREYVSQPSPPAHNAALNITTSGTAYNDGQVMFLTGMNNDPSTTGDVTLGGSTISGSGVWTGTYMGMARPSGSSFALTVPTAQAAIIHLFNAAGPAAPANLTATTGNSQATLTWSNSTGATGYVVQRSSTTGGPYATIASGVTTNSYTDTGLTNGLIYYYVVAATNSSGIGPQSAEVIASLSTAPPLTPTGLAAVPGDSVVSLSWNASPGATNYILLISTNSDESNSNVVFTPNTSYLIMGLDNGTTYYYAVSAIGPYGQSPFSAMLSATPFIGNGIAWTNTITTSAQSWNVNSNWSGNAFPNATQAVALVNSPIAANQTINLNQSVIIGELNIGASSGAAAFNVAGNGGTLTFDNTPGTAIVTQLASSKGDTISAPLVLNGSLNLYNTSINPLTLSGNITGTNNLVVNTGTVVLGGTTTYGGTTTIAQGTLQIASSLALQNSLLNHTNGSVTFNGITSATLGALSGSQNLSLINTASAALALTVGANNLNATYTGALTGSGSLTKSGAGTLTLAGTNNFTGGTTVLGGNLTVGGGTFGSSGGTILVGNGATGVSFNVTNGMVAANTLNVAPNGGSTGDSASITGTASAAFANVNLGSANNTVGNLTINTTGTVNLGNYTGSKDLQGTGPNTGGGLIINAGTVTATNVLVQNAGNLAADLNINGGSLNIVGTSGAFKIGNGNSIRGGWLTMSGGALTYLGTDGLLLNTSSGTVNGANISGAASVATLTGVTLNLINAAGATSWLIVSNGATLYLGSVGLVANQPGATVFASLANATIGAVTNWSSIAPIILAGNTTFKAADVSSGAHNISLGGVLSGGSGLTKTGTGTLTLAGTNTYSGNTVVNAGTLLANNLAGSATGSGAVTIANGGTLAGSGTISGAVTVNSGGSLAPGNPLGTLTFSNSLKLASGSTNIFEISNAPLTNSVAKIFGALTNGGTLIVTNIGVAALTNGVSFKLFNAATYHGAFNNVILPPLPAGLGWNTNSLNTSGTLSVVVMTKPFITSAVISGNGFAFTGTGGVANANFYLLGSTNLSTPVTNWTRLLTNQSDNNGNFNFTNAINTNAQTFYLLQLQ
jgi:autotransporter-associated beta strand protein